MSMRRAGVIAAVLVVGLAAPRASAQPKAAAADDEEDVVVVEDDTRPKQVKPVEDDGKLVKQDLSGHALGTNKKENAFERDRFFVDKTDTAKTEKGTLVQGSVTSTSFAYRESGGTIAPASAGVPSASPFARLFTELRLQTDFRHIAASRWESRVDVRGRAVASPGGEGGQNDPATPARPQSGQLGKNELEIKELWLLRNGVRSDVFLGRQFIADLGGVRIDGLRVDYAMSPKFTLLGFGGLYPIRGSRSITSDYQRLRSNPGLDGTRSSAGRFTGAGGFGAAYRTLDAYGSFGGVVIAPLSSETPRIYGTSGGYWRYGNKLDFYHLVILDLVGSNAVNAGLTNLSLGVNYKPDQRLRGTLSLHRVDTETLNVQAQAFLNDADPNLNVVQNEAFIKRIASNQARAAVSAGLGQLQRFELTAAVTYRYRGEVELTAPTQTAGAPTTVKLGAAQSAELYGSITDRHSIKGLRIGADGSRTFGVGGAAYQRTSALSLRAFAAHELGGGRGEWEAELAYTSAKDDNAGTLCTDLLSCFGSASSSVISLGGTVYYRINRDWFAMGSAFLNRTAITHLDAAVAVSDPAVIGISGFFRAAFRF
jgi:hypothetical protein